MTNKDIFLRGFFKENAVFTLLLGMCPALGVTSSAINGLGMGLATTFVLIMSNIVISLVSSQIPDKVKIPSFIVIIIHQDSKPDSEFEDKEWAFVIEDVS